MDAIILARWSSLPPGPLPAPGADDNDPGVPGAPPPEPWLLLIDAILAGSLPGVPGGAEGPPPPCAPGVPGAPDIAGILGALTVDVDPGTVVVGAVVLLDPPQPTRFTPSSKLQPSQPGRMALILVTFKINGNLARCESRAMPLEEAHPDMLRLGE